MTKIERNFVSEIDEFLVEFDQRPDASSPSRKAEESQYKRIGKLRDDPNVEEPKTDIWEKF